MAPPLGALEVRSGQHPTVLVSADLVKQFANSYVIYGSAQAACSAAQPGAPVEARQFQTALSTVQQL
jgi:hypothetical protein